MNNADEKLRMYSAGLCSWNEWDSSRKEAVTEMKTKQCNELIKQWSDILASDDPKAVWNKIDWKGKCNEDVLTESPE